MPAGLDGVDAASPDGTAEPLRQSRNPEGAVVHAVGVDVLDESMVMQSALGCDGAFLAFGLVSRDAEEAEAMHRLHVLGTRSALRGLRSAGIRRVVVVSTSGTIAVSDDPDRVDDESAEPPREFILRWPYYRTKLFAEEEALRANTPPDFEVVVVNPSLLLGPGDLRESSTGEVRRFLEREIPVVPAGGVAFVDARDAAEGAWLAFQRGRAGERYLLNARNMTFAALFQRLERLTGVRAPWAQLPRGRALALTLNDTFSWMVEAIGGKAPVDGPTLDMAQHYWYCSAEKAEAELGWKARDVGTTLRDTVEDMVRRGAVNPRGGFTLT
jgi:dihydroflavonol-4-reductase